jgi:hypothetical protein
MDPNINREWKCVDLAKGTPCMDSIGRVLEMNITEPR